MVEALYFVIGLMIVMGAVPVISITMLAVAIVKRFVRRWYDPAERLRYRVRLGGNVAYFIALLNAIAVLYYFITAGFPFGARFDPWLEASAQRLPEGWYLATMFAFVLGGFVLKVTRSPYAAGFVVALFGAQMSIELAPTLYDLATDPGLFDKFFNEIRRLADNHGTTGGIPGTVMGVMLYGLVYAFALQTAYYVLVTIAFLISLQGAVSLRRQPPLRFRKARPPA